MLSRLAPVFLFGALFVSACQKDPDTDPLCSFAPYATGAMFAYASDQGNFVLESTGDTLIDGYWYACLRQFPSGQESFYRCDGNNYFVSGLFATPNGVQYVQEFPYLKDQPAGSRWTYVAEWGGAQLTYQCSIVSTGAARSVGEYDFDEVTEVAVQLFHAAGQPLGTARYWYARGFGLIETDLGAQRLLDVSDRFE